MVERSEKGHTYTLPIDPQFKKVVKRQVKMLDLNRTVHYAHILNRTREQLQEDVFDVAKLRKQAPIRRPASHTTAATNMQNLQEFNRLKYRGKSDTELFSQPVISLPKRLITAVMAFKIPFSSHYNLHISTSIHTHFFMP